MSLARVRQVEDHYLNAAKWPWNKIQNDNVRTHPEWSNRLLSDQVCMLPHLAKYSEDTRRTRGLRKLGVQQQCKSTETCITGEEDIIDQDADSNADTDMTAEVTWSY